MLIDDDLAGCDSVGKFHEGLQSFQLSRMCYLEMKNLDGVVVGGREVASGGRKKTHQRVVMTRWWVLEAVQLSLKENINKHSFKNNNRHLKIVEILRAKLVALSISYVLLLPVQFGSNRFRTGSDILKF
jgi:hypothetical protein